MTQINQTQKLKLVMQTKQFLILVDLSEIQIIMLRLPNQKKKPLSISGLATTSALTAVENKIPNVSSLGKKPDYNTKISETEKKVDDHSHDKYITTPEFNTFTVESFATRLAQANLLAKRF